MPKSPQKLPTVRQVEILAFPDVTGPLDVFTTANQWAARNGLPRSYNARVVAERGPVTSSSGLALLADPLTGPSKPVDTLVVTGGPGTFAAAQSETPRALDRGPRPTGEACGVGVHRCLSARRRRPAQGPARGDSLGRRSRSASSTPRARTMPRFNFEQQLPSALISKN